jgi:hypothetical protein
MSNLRPYTKVGKANLDEDLRRNWRNNKNYYRKKIDRPFKKMMRQELKRDLRLQFLRIISYYE